MKIREQLALIAERAQFNARLGDHRLSGSSLTRGFRRWSIAGATAEVTVGVPQRGHRSLTRIAVGTVVAPGVGTLIGGMSRKQAKTVRLYVTVELADTAIVIDVPGKDEADARRFAALVNAAGRHYAAPTA